MKTLFFMLKVKGYPQFERAVHNIIKANKSKFHPEPAEGSQTVSCKSTFHCYIRGDIFRISTGAKVQDFDFAHFKSEEEICNYVAKALEILRMAMPLSTENIGSGHGKVLLDEYVETISLLR